MSQYYQPGEKINWLSLPDAYPLNMKRQENYKVLKPILVVVVAAVLYSIMSLACLLVGIFLYNSTNPNDLLPLSSLGTDLAAYIVPERPILFAVGLLSLFFIIPALALAMKICKMGNLGVFSSLAGKIRWDRIKAFVPWVALVAIVGVLLDSAIGIATGDSYVSIASMSVLPLSIIVIVLFAPLQSAGEEYAFRGFLLQTFSSWIPAIVIPFILQALVFGLLHTQYNVLGLVSTGSMGLVAGYLAIKTGGLEASITIHAANNVAGMLSACFIVGSGGVTVASCLVSLLMIAGFLVVTMWVSKKRGWIVKEHDASSER